MLMQAYLGALVSGAVLLAIALLVDDGSKDRSVALRSIAFALTVFGLSSVLAEALGLTASASSTLVLASTLGLGAAAALVVLEKRPL